MNPKQIAQKLRQALANTGHPQEIQATEADLGLILRRTPADQTQLILIRWCRQADLNERRIWRETFGVPKDVSPEFDYQNGWGMVKFSWDEEGSQVDSIVLNGQQLSLW